MNAGSTDRRRYYITKTCVICGGSWETRTKTSRTCSPTCAAIMREQEHPSTGSKKRDYPPEMIARIGELHASGMSRARITEIIGPGVSVQNILRRHFPRRRERGEIQVAPRRQPTERTDENSSQWKGDDASYAALHHRVEQVRGKPQYCACCDITGPGRYEWANLTGNYTDLDDYVRLCRSCHHRLDSRRRKALGSRTSPENRS